MAVTSEAGSGIPIAITEFACERRRRMTTVTAPPTKPTVAHHVQREKCKTNRKDGKARKETQTDFSPWKAREGSEKEITYDKGG